VVTREAFHERGVRVLLLAELRRSRDESTFSFLELVERIFQRGLRALVLGARRIERGGGFSKLGGARRGVIFKANKLGFASCCLGIAAVKLCLGAANLKLEDRLLAKQFADRLKLRLNIVGLEQRVGWVYQRGTWRRIIAFERGARRRMKIRRRRVCWLVVGGLAHLHLLLTAQVWVPTSVNLLRSPRLGICN